MVESVPMVRSQ
jgi:hypothetical protein